MGVSYNGLPTSAGIFLQGNLLLLTLGVVLSLVVGAALVLIGISTRSKGTRTAGAVFLVLMLVLLLLDVLLSLFTFS